MEQILLEEQILKDPRGNRERKAEALRFLVHFIGDVHQPLHVADNNDHGGNLTEVRFQGRTSSIHQIWDSRIFAYGRLRDSVALERLFEGQKLVAWSRGDLISWVNESHRLASRAYRIPPSRTLGRDYLRVNLQVVEEQVMKGGLRLASTLNAIALRQ